MGVSQPAGGALVYSKTKTSAVFNMTNNNPVVGQDYNLGTSNAEFAYKAKIVVSSIDSRVSNLESTVDSLSSQVESLDLNAIKESDLTLESLGNLFNTANIINGQYINSGGSFTTAADWSMIRFRVKELTSYTWGRLSTANPSYYTFFNETLSTKTGNGSFNPANPATQIVPAGSYWGYINIKRPGEPTSVYEQGTINEGTELLTPYKPYEGQTVTKIKGYNLAASDGGGEAYDQSLNTTDSVQFAGVSTPILVTAMLQADLPEGSGTPPVGVEIGDAWIDTTNDTIKVRRS